MTKISKPLNVKAALFYDKKSICFMYIANERATKICQHYDS